MVMVAERAGITTIIIITITTSIRGKIGQQKYIEPIPLPKPVQRNIIFPRPRHLIPPTVVHIAPPQPKNVLDEKPPHSGGTRRIGDGVAVQSCGQQRAVTGWH